MTTYNIEQYMKDLEYLVNIDCNAQNFAGIDKVADYLAKDFIGPMWRVKRVDCGPDCAKPLVITNTDDYASIKPLHTGDTKAGQDFLAVNG